MASVKTIMIQIELNFFVTLSVYLPRNKHAFTVPEGTTVEMLMKKLDIPDDAVKLIFVNGRKQDKTYCLQNHDRLGLFPPVGGG